MTAKRARANSIQTQKKLLSIGAFEVPDWKDIPEIDILIETRKGVALSYTNEKIAG